jgi:hypothetical protein
LKRRGHGGQGQHGPFIADPVQHIADRAAGLVEALLAPGIESHGEGRITGHAGYSRLT